MKIESRMLNTLLQAAISTLILMILDYVFPEKSPRDYGLIFVIFYILHKINDVVDQINKAQINYEDSSDHNEQ